MEVLDQDLSEKDGDYVAGGATAVPEAQFEAVLFCWVVG